jgi:2-(1,2-epoxy-1,2-dihydrophenyl)acetyl-CoA isomerase
VSTDLALAGGDLLHRVEDGVAWLRLNRPDAANALTPDQRDAIIGLLREYDESSSVRAIVLTAAGRHFCGGADLRIDRPEMGSPQAPDGHAPGGAVPGGAVPDGAAPDGPAAGTVMKTIAYGAHRLVTALQDCQKPVLASVQGTAAGLGVQLALACDLVLMAEEASFIEIFVQRGLLADGGAAYLLTRLAGVQRAKELMLLGGRISAAKACGYGLVTEVVPRDQLEARTAELARTLAQGPTVAIGLMKRLANRALDADRNGALFEEALAQELVTKTADAQAGIAAFVERRPAEFRGF